MPIEYSTHPKNGDKILRLSFGCMRLEGDYAAAERQVLYAVERGINYFDTAYIYPGNEALLGKILIAGKCRNSLNITTKLPHFFVRKSADIESFFLKQLSRLKTDMIDYYLMHMLTSFAEWQRMVELGIIEWIEAKKKAGAIRNIGFSFHGGREDFFKISAAYNWDICMIQYNYYDENNQAGRAGLKYAAALGIPVAIMEPLRGGRLANRLPKAAQDIWNSAKEQRTPADWALRWLFDQSEVFTVLSGMNSIDVINKNIEIAQNSSINCLAESERQLYQQARKAMMDATAVACTGCNYCMPCPAGVDIPLCFSFLNDLAMCKKFATQLNYITRAGGRQASLCVGCKKCEQHCPQSIPIREKLKETVDALESFPYKPMRAIVGKLTKYGK